MLLPVADNTIKPPPAAPARAAPGAPFDARFPITALAPVIILVIALCHSPGVDAQESVSLSPTRDNTLYESTDGSLSNGAGEHLFAGRIVQEELRRAVLAFDDLSALPDNVAVTDVRLRVTLDRTIAGPVTVNAHLLNAPWGEGSARADAPEGRGGQALGGDATWLHGRFDTTRWSRPGGDFDPAPAASAEIDQPGAYELVGNERLRDAVQSWIDGDAENHGVILLAESQTDVTAKRFSSREGASPPELVVTFVPREQAPPPVLRISGLWFDPTADGEGFNVIESSAGLTIFFYGYGEGETRLWLVTETLAAPIRAGEPLTLSVFVGTPGSFAVPTPSSELEVWGTLVLTAVDCTSARFVLDGRDGRKEADAVLLAAVSGVGCAIAGVSAGRDSVD